MTHPMRVLENSGNWDHSVIYESAEAAVIHYTSNGNLIGAVVYTSREGKARLVPFKIGDEQGYGYARDIAKNDGGDVSGLPEELSA